MHRVRPLLVLFGLALVATAAGAQPRDSRFVTLESVALWETERGAELEILAGAELAWTLRYDEDGGFAIRLPGAVRGPKISNLDFADGPVSEVRVRSLGSGGEVSTLIEVAAREPLRVSVTSEDRLLRARIDLVGDPPAEQPQAVATVAQVSSQAAALPAETPSVDDDSPGDLATRLASAEASIERMVEEEDELRFELQRVRDERDALSLSTRIYRVAERASPCLNVRTEPNGTVLDCVEPGTPTGSLSTRGAWNKVRLPDGREAWARSEFLEPSEATAPAELELKLQQTETELEAARGRNRALEERADGANASLERAWEAQQNLSAQLAVLQAAKDGAGNGSTEPVEQVGNISSSGGSTYVVSGVASCLNLRPEPEAEGRIDCLPVGTRTTVVEVVGTWGRLLLVDGRTGWASMAFLEPAPDLPEGVSALAEARARIRELEAATAGSDQEARLDRLEADNGVIQTALDQAKLEVTNLEGALDASERENADIQSELDNSKHERTDLQARLEAAEATVGSDSEAEGNLEVVRAQLLTTQQDLRIATVERVAFLDRLEVLEDDLAAARGEADVLSDDLGRARSELAQRQDETAASEGERVGALEDELADARSRLETLTAERDQLRARAETAEDRAVELEGDVESQEATAIAKASELQARLETTDAELKAEMDERAATEARADQLEAELERLKREVESGQVESGQQEAAATERITALEGELDEARTRVGSLESDLTTSSTELEKAISRITTVESDLSSSQAEATRLQSALEEGNAERGQQESAATERITGIEAELDKERVRVGSLESDLATSSTELEGANSRIRAVESDLTSSQAEATRLQTALEELNAEHGQQESAATERVTALEAELGKARARVGSLESDLASSSTDLERAKDRITTVESDLSSSQAEATRLQTALEEGNAERGQRESAATERITGLEAELDETRARVGSLESDLATSLTDLEGAKDRITTVESDLSSSQAEATRLQSALEEGNAERGQQESAATERIAALEAELESTEHERGEWQRRTETALADAANLATALESASQQTAELDEARTALGRWSGRVEELESQIAGTNEVLKVAVAERDEANARLEETRQTLEGAKVELMVTAEPCLNLRTAPGTGEPIDCLPTGTRVVVTELANEWARVRLDSGASGWAARAFIQPAPETPPEIEALASARAEIAELQATSASRIEALEAQAETAESAKLEAESRLGGLENELRAEKERGLAVETELQNARERTSELESASRSAGDNVAKLAMSLATIERLKGELGEAGTAATAAAATRDDLEARLESQSETRAQLEAQLESGTETSTQLEAANREIAGLRDLVEAERGQRTELAQKLEAAEGQLTLQTGLSERLDGQESELETTRQWLTAAEEKNAELEARVEASARFLTNLGEELRREREAKRALEESLGNRVASLEANPAAAERGRADMAPQADQPQADLEVTRNELERIAATEPTAEEPRSLPELEPEAELQSDPEPEPEAEPQSDSEPEPEPEAGPQSDPELEPEPEPDTAPAAPASRAASLPDTSPAVLGTVARDWARAWSLQEVDDYLSFYSKRFVPPNDLDRTTWEEQRRARLTRPAFIEVGLSDLEVRSSGNAPPAIRFTQTYNSDTFSDIVLKTLVLTWEDGGWRILGESSTPLE